MATETTITRNYVLRLMKEKDAIEAEINEFQNVLKTQKNVGLREALVDRDGFPRNDIDVYSVRVARNKIICLQNDHKELMLKIEDALHQLHKREKENIGEVCNFESEKTVSVEEMESPFARIDLVTPGSPAKEAGLQVGDLILEFGSVNSKNFQSLQNVADVVQHSLGKPTSITVLRDGSKVHLGLIQNHWSGKGLIGCKMVPV